MRAEVSGHTPGRGITDSMHHTTRPLGREGQGQAAAPTRRRFVSLRRGTLQRASANISIRGLRPWLGAALLLLALAFAARPATSVLLGGGSGGPAGGYGLSRAPIK